VPQNLTQILTATLRVDMAGAIAVRTARTRWAKSIAARSSSAFSAESAIYGEEATSHELLDKRSRTNEHRMLQPDVEKASDELEMREYIGWLADGG
jgi:hypothetical protein